MSDDKLYVRFRGRVSGPYTLGDVQRMLHRGQLSRMHQVSADRQAWQRVAEHPTLGGTTEGREQPDEPQSAGDADADVFAAAIDGVDAGPQAPTGEDDHVAVPQTKWYYSLNDERVGPAPTTVIRQMIAEKSLAPDALLWRPGMADWVSLEDAELLEAAGPRGGHHVPEREARRAEVPRRLGTTRWLAWGAAAALVISAAGTASWMIWARAGHPSESTTSASARPAPQSSMIITSVQDGENLAKAVALVVVGVEVVTYEGDLHQVPIGQGSAFAIDTNGLMLTNRHVLEQYLKLSRGDRIKEDFVDEANLNSFQERIWVFIGGRKYSGQLVHASSQHDWAVIRVDMKFEAVFRIGERSDDLLDTEVRAVGFPGNAAIGFSLGEDIEQFLRAVLPHEDATAYFKDRDFVFVLTSGRVSQVVTDSTTGVTWIQHTANIGPGSSGGPLVKPDGTVVGINTLLAPGEDGGAAIYRAMSLTGLHDEIAQVAPASVWRP